MRSIKKNKPRVFIVEKRDYLECLKYLGQRPLKLIANSFYPHESAWKETRWSFKSDRNTVKDKKVLTNPKDTFQFSIANEFSKQDYHIHKSTFEIYISDFQMELESGEEEKFICKKGIVIVPPGTRHKIKLYGTTYVLQVKQKNLPINSDKEIFYG